MRSANNDYWKVNSTDYLLIAQIFVGVSWVYDFNIIFFAVSFRAQFCLVTVRGSHAGYNLNSPLLCRHDISCKPTPGEKIISSNSTAGILKCGVIWQFLQGSRGRCGHQQSVRVARVLPSSSLESPSQSSENHCSIVRVGTQNMFSLEQKFCFSAKSTSSKLWITGCQDVFWGVGDLFHHFARTQKNPIMFVWAPAVGDSMKYFWQLTVE